MATEKMPKILVADDDEGYRFPMVSLFKDYGFEVLEATDQAEVLKHGREAGVWIIDVRLPTSAMEGIMAVQELVNNNIKPNCLVIFISVIPEELALDKLRALRDVGIKYEWIEKPLELEFLLEKVTKFLKEAS